MKQPRPFYLILVLSCVALLSFGYYLQFVDGLEPCPLCIFQRVAYMAIVVIAGIGLIHAPEKFWLRIYSGLISVSALIGLSIAARQVWLQHLPPDQLPECGPGLDYMLEVFPFTETLRIVLAGSGECATVDWLFLSLSMAEWSLVCFSLLLIGSTIHLIRGRVYNLI